MVTPIEITTAPTYTNQTVTAVITSTVVESATALANRKGVTFRNRGPSNLLIAGASGDQSAKYMTLEPGDSVVYVVVPASPTTILWYFAVPTGGSTVVEREEWL